jgi:hypothetical protein
MEKLNITAAPSVQSKWSTGKRAKLKLAAIQDRAVRNTTMLVLENIDKDSAISSGNFLVEENNTIGTWTNAGTLGTGVGSGAGVTGNTAMYHPVSMALARRVLPSLFAHKLVGVQPMNAPVGVAFAMRSYHATTPGQLPDSTYSTVDRNAAEAAWVNIDKNAGFSGGYVATSATYTITTDVAGTPTPSGPISVNIVPKFVPGTGDSNPATGVYTDATEFNQAIINRTSAIYANGGTIGEPGSTITWNKPNFSTNSLPSDLARGISTKDSELLGVLDANGTVNGSPVTAQNKINEIGVQFDKKLIEATERRLAASFSLQAMQDIKALHNLDLKMEVLEVLQYETTAELDRELLNALKTTSIDTENGGGNVLVVDVTDGNTISDNRQSTAIVVNAILLAANTVAKYAKRGKANFVVVSPTVGSVLQSAVPFFTANEAKVDPGIVLSGSESTEIGKLNGVLTVYLDQFATTDYALVGYKGGNVAAYDSGVIFCPYTMNIVNEAIAQENFQPRIGVMSRYAVATNLLSAGAYYRSIVFTGLDSIFGGSNWTGITGW